MRPPGIKVNYPFLKNTAKVVAGYGNQVIQTLLPECADRSLADSIGHRCTNRCLQYFKAEMLDRSIQVAPGLPVSISNQEAIAMVAGNRLPKLLQRPITARVCSDVNLENFFASRVRRL